MRVSIDAVLETGAVCEAGHLLHGRHPRPGARRNIRSKYYVDMAKELEKLGAHFLAIKDMAGLCKPYAAFATGEGAARRNRHSRSFPHARHQRRQRRLHPESLRRRRGRGRRRARLHERRHQPAQSEFLVAALRHTPRDTGLDLDALNECSDLLGNGARLLSCRSITRPRPGSARRLPARNSRRPVHEPARAGRSDGPGRIAGTKSSAPTPT